VERGDFEGGEGMETERIRLLVDLEIHEGKFADFEALAKEMVAVSDHEPGTLNYKFYLSADANSAGW
jgi:quinol monooxygenase YgiN